MAKKKEASIREEHLTELAESGVSPTVARMDGVRSVSAKEAYAMTGLPIGPGWAALYGHPDDGERVWCVKPDVRWKGSKYVWTIGKKRKLGFPPGIKTIQDNAEVPLLFVEGRKKMLSVFEHRFDAIDVHGVWNFQRKGILLDCFDWLTLDGRDVYIGFDSDALRIQPVFLAAIALAFALEGRGANVKLLVIPENSSGDKNGIDNYLMESDENSIEDLIENSVTPAEYIQLRLQSLPADQRSREYRSVASIIHKWCAPARQSHYLSLLKGEYFAITSLATDEIKGLKEPLRTILSKLKGLAQNEPGEFSALCPAHDDHRPSLSIREGKDGRVLVYCFAGCEFEEIAEALDLEAFDFFRAEPGKGQMMIYNYKDTDGSLLFQVVRSKNKKFWQRRPNGKGGWIKNIHGVKRVVYRLPEIVASGGDDWVIVVEGEKDADRLHDLGLTATTCPMGAGAWKKVDDTPLHGRRVAIVPDNDAPGRKHASEVANSLYGKADDLRIIELPGLESSGDVSDWLDAGGTCDELVALVEATPNVDDTSTNGEKGKKAIGLLIRNMADIQPQEVEWLIPGWIPLGKLTMLVGDPGVGKSFLTCEIAAKVTTGQRFPFSPKSQPPGSVLILSAEDDPADTIRPRLDAAHADIKRVSVVEGVTSPNDHYPSHFSLNDDLHHLEAALDKDPDVRLVIIDPISAYMGKTDSHNNADVRGVLAPLSAMAARYKVAVLAVSHLNKGSGEQAIYRTMGSLAFTAGPRAVHFVSKEPGTDRRILTTVKMNIEKPQAPMAYLINDGRLRWNYDPIEYSPQELLRGKAKGDETLTVLDEAVEWLEDLLQSGPMPSGDIKSLASEEGISEATLRRAQEKLGVTSIRVGGLGKEGHWEWSLRRPSEPKACTPDE